jgi:ABC-type lipoprotein release transport system permease subunit
METIIVALISLIGTLSGTVGGIVISSKLTNYRLEQVEQKVEKLEALVVKSYKLEEQTTLQNEQIANITKRLDKLEAAQ